MAELTPAERLQPCLLDRLTDEEPDKTAESRERRIVSITQYRQAVLRDLVWLLNSRARPAGDEIYDYDEAAASVLNFGLHDLCGLTAAGVNPAEIQREIARSVERFEPRILPKSLAVKWASEQGQIEYNAIAFEIRGVLWAQPTPDQLYIKTEIDLETGHCDLVRNLSG